MRWKSDHWCNGDTFTPEPCEFSILVPTCVNFVSLRSWINRLLWRCSLQLRLRPSGASFFWASILWSVFDELLGNKFNRWIFSLLGSWTRSQRVASTKSNSPHLQLEVQTQNKWFFFSLGKHSWRLSFAVLLLGGARSIGSLEIQAKVCMCCFNWWIQEVFFFNLVLIPELLSLLWITSSDSSYILDVISITRWSTDVVATNLMLLNNVGLPAELATPNHQLSSFSRMATYLQVMLLVVYFCRNCICTWILVTVSGLALGLDLVLDSFSSFSSSFLLMLIISWCEFLFWMTIKQRFAVHVTYVRSVWGFFFFGLVF
jgi:hypothetical protein